MKHQQLKTWLLNQLETGKKINISWDEGGDDACMESFIEDEEGDNEMLEALDDLLMEKMNIGGAGEYSLQGKGVILIENGQIIVEHHAEGYAYDYDEATDEHRKVEYKEEPTQTVLFHLQNTQTQ